MLKKRSPDGFAKIDGNGDGKLSAAEIHAALLAAQAGQKPASGAQTDPPGTAAGAPAPAAAHPAGAGGN